MPHTIKERKLNTSGTLVHIDGYLQGSNFKSTDCHMDCQPPSEDSELKRNVSLPGNGRYARMLFHSQK